MMASFGPWADLPSDAISGITDRLATLQSYVYLRAVCTAWRSALAPVSSPLLLVAKDPVRSRAAFSLLQGQRSFEFPAGRRLPRTIIGSHCVGARDGWFAVTSYAPIVLQSPLTGEQIYLPILNQSHWVPKVVFSPNPKPDDFTAATIVGDCKLAYVQAPDRRWVVLEIARLKSGDRLTDVAYHDDKVYSLTTFGDVHVLHLPTDRRPTPTLEPLLLSSQRRRFDPADFFPPPYNTISKVTSTKHLAFCDGNLYQIWRAPTQMPRGGKCRVSENEIFVLRHDPGRQHCWNEAKDLGGYSVFVGRNNAVSVRPESVPGLRGNCVYWIGGAVSEKGMVFDMESRRSTQCLPPADDMSRPSLMTTCWYFLPGSTDR